MPYAPYYEKRRMQSLSMNERIIMHAKMHIMIGLAELDWSKNAGN